MQALAGLADAGCQARPVELLNPPAVLRVDVGHGAQARVEPENGVQPPVHQRAELLAVELEVHQRGHDGDDDQHDELQEPGHHNVESVVAGDEGQMAPVGDHDDVRQLGAVVDRGSGGCHGNEEDDHDNQALACRDDEVPHDPPLLSPQGSGIESRAVPVAVAGRPVAPLAAAPRPPAPHPAGHQPAPHPAGPSLAGFRPAGPRQVAPRPVRPRPAAPDDVRPSDRARGGGADAQPQGEHATAQRIDDHPGGAARNPGPGKPRGRQQPRGPHRLKLPVHGVVAPGSAGGRIEQPLRARADTAPLQGCQLEGHVGALDHQLVRSLVAYQVVSHVILRARSGPVVARGLLFSGPPVSSAILPGAIGLTRLRAGGAAAVRL